MVSKELTIIFTLYNKESEIEETVDLISGLLNEKCISYEIILCNDGSTDNTSNVCKSIAEKYSNIKLIGYENNKGRGFAVKKSLLESNGKKIFYMDSDISKTTDSQILLTAINFLDKFPVIIGNRFDKKSTSRRKLIRSVFGYGYRKIVKLFFPEVKVSDGEVGFKGFNSEVVKKYAILCMENRWSFDLELLWVLTKNKIQIHEIPMDWSEYYENYHSSVKLLSDTWSQFFGFFRIRLRHRN